MQLFYCPNLKKQTTHFIFDRVESKHIVTVLRKKAGERIQLTNGKGTFFEVDIIDCHPSKCSVKVISYKDIIRGQHEVHIAFAPPKSRDRLEWIIEKATEIGVRAIHPIFCENSERHQINTDRLRNISISATKQSYQAFVPDIMTPKDFYSFVKQTIIPKRYIGCCAEGYGQINLSKRIRKSENSIFVVGPEGDFSKNEMGLAIENGFIPATLGQTRLRTETAAILACYELNHL